MAQRQEAIAVHRRDTLVVRLRTRAFDLALGQLDQLVEVYRAVAGEHPDWDDYRRSMVADRRVVVTLRPTHAYGMLAPPGR